MCPLHKSARDCSGIVRVIRIVLAVCVVLASFMYRSCIVHVSFMYRSCIVHASFMSFLPMQHLRLKVVLRA